MAKMNWNRPNNGYELEPWQKRYQPAAKPKLSPKPVRDHRSQGHKILLTKSKSGPHYGFYKCIDCKKWLAWASKETK